MFPPVSPQLTIDDWSLVRIRLNWCYDTRVNREHRTYHVEKNANCAWYLRSGNVRIRYAGGGPELRAQAGDWLFAVAGEWDHEFSKDARIISINYVAEWPTGELLFKTPQVVPGSSCPALMRATMALQRFLSKKFHRVRILVSQHPTTLPVYFEVQALFARWMRAYLSTAEVAGTIHNPIANTDSRIKAILASLDRLGWQESLSTEQLASAHGLSRGHLDRIFLRDIGMTPRAYLQKRRIDCACTRLLEPGRSIKQIGYELGFSSPAHFSRWFHQHAGQSPRTYAKDHHRS
jgi:AraC-like DNA-binding protein